ncbi:MAG: copper resistance protein NlpE [Paramuribaculum sp.]|nr:copper resistance protein NlpE [Paramuribaculum sp.]MDE7470124.1 copper resistance protein NlpE [Paramuribaculum sp.]
MKKSILMGAAALAMVSMAACSGNKTCDSAANCAKGDIDAVYTGLLPAADAAGIRYTLTLDYDDEGNKGDFDLIETYLQGDSTSALGYTDLKTFTSKGDFTVGKQGDKTFIKLVEKGSSSIPTYFLVDSDSTITMTNEDLDVTHLPGMNYTLKLASK